MSRNAAAILLVVSLFAGNLGAAPVTPTTATITWTTDRPATSQVEYESANSYPYDSASLLDQALTHFHSVTLTGLTPGTLYHYRVKSVSFDGFEGVSDHYIFQTPLLPSPADRPPPPVLHGEEIR